MKRPEYQKKLNIKTFKEVLQNNDFDAELVSDNILSIRKMFSYNDGSKYFFYFYAYFRENLPILFFGRNKNIFNDSYDEVKNDKYKFYYFENKSLETNWALAKYHKVNFHFWTLDYLEMTNSELFNFLANLNKKIGLEFDSDIKFICYVNLTDTRITNFLNSLKNYSQEEILMRLLENYLNQFLSFRRNGEWSSESFSEKSPFENFKELKNAFL